MGIVYCVLTLLVVLGAIHLFSKRHHPEDGSEADVNSVDYEKAAFNVMKGALESIGCQPRITSETNLDVDFQGENFLIECHGLYARIWDLEWGHFKVDGPEFNLLFRAVNAVNLHSGYAPTVVLSLDRSDKDMIVLHSKITVLLFPSFPHPDAYVSSVLRSFFSVKDEVKSEYHDFDVSQRPSQQNRPKVGFVQPQEEDVQPQEEEKH